MDSGQQIPSGNTPRRSTSIAPCPKCSRPLLLADLIDAFRVLCPACGINPVLFFAGCGEGPPFAEMMVRFLCDKGLLAKDHREAVMAAKKDSSTHSMVDFLISLGYVKPDELRELALSTLPQWWITSLKYGSGMTAHQDSVGLIDTQKLLKGLESVRQPPQSLTEEQINSAREKQKEMGGPLWKSLVEMGLISEDDVMKAMTIEDGLIKLSEMQLPKDVIEKVPSALARAFGVVPVSFHQGLLMVATAEQVGPVQARVLKSALKCQVGFLFAPSDEIEKALDRYYPRPQSS
jgi:hypothetical protein